MSSSGGGGRRFHRKTMPSREEILYMGLDEFVAIVEGICRERELTFEEKGLVKRYRRMISNRLQAKESRARNKRLIQSLKDRVTDLENQRFIQQESNEQEVTMLRRLVSDSLYENSALRHEITEIRSRPTNHLYISNMNDTIFM